MHDWAEHREANDGELHWKGRDNIKNLIFRTLCSRSLCYVVGRVWTVFLCAGDAVDSACVHWLHNGQGLRPRTGMSRDVRASACAFLAGPKQDFHSFYGPQRYFQAMTTDRHAQVQCKYKCGYHERRTRVAKHEERAHWQCRECNLVTFSVRTKEKHEHAGLWEIILPRIGDVFAEFGFDSHSLPILQALGAMSLPPLDSATHEFWDTPSCRPYILTPSPWDNIALNPICLWHIVNAALYEAKDTVSQTTPDWVAMLTQEKARDLSRGRYSAQQHQVEPDHA